MAQTAKLSLHGVAKSFGAKHVLTDVNLEVPAGSSVVVIGGSGTGKSVLLKCILGILRPDGGTIALDGKDIARVHGHERDKVLKKFGMLFQGAALFDSLPVWENVSFGLIQGHGMNRKKAKTIAIEMLEKVGLGADVADLSPAELSGGMKKRVGLARAIATQPEIIFFDEPTTGLDPIMADVINHLIIERVRELGATALSITHDMSSVRMIADYVAMLHQGVIVWYGPVDDLDDSGNEVVDQFVNGRREGPIKVDPRH